MMRSQTPWHIMQIVHDLAFGGMQRVVIDLCLQLDPSRFKLSVCCLEEFGPNFKILQSNNIPVYLVQKKSGIDFSLPFRLSQLLRRNGIHLVHTHGINPFFYGTIGAKVLSAIPIVQTDHARGLFPVSGKEMFSERILSFFTDRIVAVSKGVKNDLIAYEHINTHKIDVIYNGINGDRFQTVSPAPSLRSDLKLEPDDIVVGIGVRLTEQKGISNLLKAIAYLPGSLPNYKLLIIGDGPLRTALENEARRLSIDGKVVFAGYRSDIPALLKVIDIYCLPSLWEGHPLVLLEAMASSLPVVATDIPGNNETVEHGLTGLLVPPNSYKALSGALHKLLSDEKERNRMGKNGFKKFMKKYTVDKMVKQYEDLYASVLSNMKNPR